MSHITNFYNDLRNDIRRANSARALKTLNKKGRKYLKNLSTNTTKSEVIREAKFEYNKSVKEIKNRLDVIRNAYRK